MLLKIIILLQFTHLFGQRLIISDINVCDVEKGIVLKHYHVFINDNTITKISNESLFVADFPNATVIEGKGLFLLPGFIDAHVHLGIGNSEQIGLLLLAKGITTVRDTGWIVPDILSLRDKFNSGELLGPRVHSCGNLIDGIPKFFDWALSASSPEEGRVRVKEMKLSE